MAPRRRTGAGSAPVRASNAAEFDLELDVLGMRSVRAQRLADEVGVDAVLAVLEAAWGFRRDELLARCQPGVRCWGWWAFDLREWRPSSGVGQVARLLELGELADLEIEALLAEADRLVIERPPPWASDGISPAIAIAAMLRGEKLE